MSPRQTPQKNKIIMTDLHAGVKKQALIMRLLNARPARKCRAALLVLAGCGLTVAAAADAAPPAKEKLHLFLLAGQSNMAGRGAVADLDAAEQAPDPRVLALDAVGEWRPATDPLHWDKSAAGVGIGKFFGRMIADTQPGVTAGLIPTACGGSSITVWEPGRFFDQTQSHPWDDALQRTRRALRDGTLKAILWHQGESDAGGRNADLYEERLEKLINRFRTELGAPDLPFIIGQLGRFDGRPWTPGMGKVDQAHRAVAERVKNVYFVTAGGLTSKDKLHFDTPSLRILARRYADAYHQHCAEAGGPQK